MTADVTVRSYGPSGTGTYTTLERVWGVRWTDELNGAGTGQFSIHADDVQATEALLADNRVVKFVYEGAERFAFRVRTRDRTQVSDAEAAGRVITVSGPGVSGDLQWCAVFPWYGFRSPDVRSFTYAGTDGAWRTGTWAAPLGSAHSGDVRYGLLQDWPTAADSAQWIWPTDPTADSASGGKGYFRTTFTLSAETPVVVFSTGDDVLDLYLDEEHLVVKDSPDSLTWETANRHELTLSAGDHLLGAEVTNLGLAGVASPAGLLLAVFTLNTDGTPGTLLCKSDTSWTCIAGPDRPGWFPAQILRRLVEENQAEGVTPANYLTLGFTASADSDSVTWAGDKADRDFRVGDNLLSVAQQLSENGLDWWVTPGMVLEALPARGTTKAVTLAEAVNLRGLETQAKAAEMTRALVRSGIGWFERGSTVEGTAGTWLGALSFGDVEDTTAADNLAATVMADLSVGQASHTVEVAVLPGTQPYVDFEVGDTVTAPGEWGGAEQLRIRALTVTEDEDGRVRCVPEFVES